ncbi:unnamed protein product [Calicophoron daubneyi]|uniref:Uncharacterized protein n=1 Tax=Calicophoron daubneyi TaxID=300641 RepID=A0AAV2TU76_CALDB
MSGDSNSLTSSKSSPMVNPNLAGLKASMLIQLTRTYSHLSFKHANFLHHQKPGIYSHRGIAGIRYDRTTEYRRRRRIEMHSKLPPDMYLPLINPVKVTTVVLCAYLLSVIILLVSFGVIVFFDQKALQMARRTCCFFCCCMYCCGNAWYERADMSLQGHGSDESSDDLCCFKVSESVRRKRWITVSSYDRIQKVEEELHKDSVKFDERSKSIVGTSRTRLFSERSFGQTSGSRSGKTKDNLLRVRLEFLSDLATYMAARSAEDVLDTENSISDEETSIRTDFSASTGNLSTTEKQLRQLQLLKEL